MFIEYNIPLMDIMLNYILIQWQTIAFKNRFLWRSFISYKNKKNYNISIW